MAREGEGECGGSVRMWEWGVGEKGGERESERTWGVDSESERGWNRRKRKRARGRERERGGQRKWKKERERGERGEGRGEGVRRY